MYAHICLHRNSRVTIILKEEVMSLERGTQEGLQGESEGAVHWVLMRKGLNSNIIFKKAVPFNAKVDLENAVFLWSTNTIVKFNHEGPSCMPSYLFKLATHRLNLQGPRERQQFSLCSQTAPPSCKPSFPVMFNTIHC